MGKDVERILSGINLIKDKTIEASTKLSNQTAYGISCNATHGGTSTASCTPTERSVSIKSSTFIDPIREASESIIEDFDKMDSLSSNLYTSVNSFNNEYGSPWTELSLLNSSIQDIGKFAGSYSNLGYVGEKAALLSLLNMILSISIDAKWALINYHDYIQRGYDNRYNDNEPSIKFKSGIDKESIGNVNQEYYENVNIKKQSIDPF